MTIQKYPLNLVYHPGKELILVDTLSRAFLQDDDYPLEEQFEVNTLSTIPMSDTKLAELKEETKGDKQLQQLTTMINAGWPANKKDTPKECRPFWNFQDELSVSDSIIFEGEKIVILKKMQSEMLRYIHGSLLGIEKCKR